MEEAIIINLNNLDDSLKQINVVEYDAIRVALSGKIEQLPGIPSSEFIIEQRKKKEQNKEEHLITK